MFEQFTPKFDANGLITAVALDADTGEVLMLAHMNQAAIDATLATGQVHYYSRSRQELWRKGATSGHTQALVEMRVDCDQDAVIMRVVQDGAACHLGERSCFFRVVAPDGSISRPATS
ncbi:MAG: phosphoribosyl-AMP cyclohydrolase [Pseudomonadota bacterium]